MPANSLRGMHRFGRSGVRCRPKVPPSTLDRRCYGFPRPVQDAQSVRGDAKKLLRVQSMLVSRPVRNAVYLYLATIAGVILIGGLRLSCFPPSSKTVRIALLSKRPAGTEPNSQSMNHLLANEATCEDFTEIRECPRPGRCDLSLPTSSPQQEVPLRLA